MLSVGLVQRSHSGCAWFECRCIEGSIDHRPLFSPPLLHLLRTQRKGSYVKSSIVVSRRLLSAAAVLVYDACKAIYKCSDPIVQGLV